MKYLILILSFIISTSFAFSQNETSLFNSIGKPIAYISDENLTIYLWDGKPVAYLSKFDGEFHIYGFNGKHLGWFIKGIVRDHEGDAVGSTKEGTNTNKENEPNKSNKSNSSNKSNKENAPNRPNLSNSWSSKTLKLFLLQGIED